MNRMILFTLALCCFVYGNSQAADLIISGQNNKTYQNGSYGKLSINNSSNITVKNCTFLVSANANGAYVGQISGSNHITIDSCDFDGDTTTCSGLNISGSFITIQHCKIHDVADDAISCNTGNHIYFYNNTLCHLFGCGTDGGCGPCYNGHSDGFELGMLDSVELIGNLVYDVRSTSAIILDNWQGDSANLHNLLLENNIFYTPETGVVVYVFYVDGVRMYNNTIWKSNWLGVTVGVYSTRIEMYNNIVQCIDYTFGGGTLAADHKYDYNLVGFANRGLAAQAHDVVNADPKFRKIPIASDNNAAHVYRDVVPADFELMAGSPAIGKGRSDALMPATDFYGNPRQAPYDMGAIAYGSSPVSRKPVSPLSIINGTIRITPNPCRRNSSLILEGHAADANSMLEIYAVNGDRIRTFPLNSRNFMINWDGKDEQGNFLTSGLYQVMIRSTGNSKKEALVILQ
jgi:hypothetical protein